MGKKRSAEEVETADDGGSGAARATEGSDKGDKEKRVRKEKSKEGKEKAVKPEVVVAEVPGQGKAKGSGASKSEQSSGAAGGSSHTEGTGGRRSRGVSSVPQETLQYLTEVVQHYATLTEGEERELLVGNVLEELQGKEVVVAGDQICSRHIETLLAGASPAQLIQFLASVHAAEGMQALSSSPFGSHVLEKVMVAIDKGLEALDSEQYASVEKLFTDIGSVVCEQLGSYITDRFATHVARRLLCIAVGRNVLPATKQQQKQLATKMKGPSALAARMGSSGKGGKGAVDDSAAPRFPEIILAAAKVLMREDYQGEPMGDIVYSLYGAPYVQGLLTALAFDRKTLTAVLPCVLCATYFNDGAKAGKVFEGVAAEDFDAMVWDSTASHVVEVVLQVAPPAAFDELLTRFLKDKLQSMCAHSSANFVVQAAIAAAPKPEHVKAMYEELAGSLGELMKKRRSGVVAALVAACGSKGCCQREICAELEKVLLGLPGWAGMTPEQGLAPALLCLDSATALGPNADPNLQGYSARLSTLGASILVCILGYGQGACRQFTDSVAALHGKDAARVGADPAGSRVLEALLEGSAPPKVKARLMGNLKGSYGKVAMTAAGSFVVERCYNWGDADVKEAIAGELVGAQKELQGSHWGPSLLKRVGAEAFARDPEQWRRHAEASQKAMAQFSQLFGGDDGQDKKEAKEKKGKKEKRGKEDKKRSRRDQEDEEGEEDQEGAREQQDEGADEGAEEVGEEEEAGEGAMEEAGPLGHEHVGPELQGAAAEAMATLGFGVAGVAGVAGGNTRQGLSGAERRKAKKKAKQQAGGEEDQALGQGDDGGSGHGGGDELDALFAPTQPKGKGKGKKK